MRLPCHFVRFEIESSIMIKILEVANKEDFTKIGIEPRSKNRNDLSKRV